MHVYDDVRDVRLFRIAQGFGFILRTKFLQLKGIQAMDDGEKSKIMAYYKILLRTINIYRVHDTGHLAGRLIGIVERFSSKCTKEGCFSRSSRTTNIAQEYIPCHLALPAI